jgi:hypothetical protein
LISGSVYRREPHVSENILPKYSGSKSKSNKKSGEEGCKFIISTLMIEAICSPEMSCSQKTALLTVTGVRTNTVICLI